jgi:hypothetical protein
MVCAYPGKNCRSLRFLPGYSHTLTTFQYRRQRRSNSECRRWWFRGEQVEMTKGSIKIEEHHSWGMFLLIVGAQFMTLV